MISRINNNNSFQQIENSNTEQDVKSAEVGATPQGLITENGLPSLNKAPASGGNAAATEGKHLMNIRAGLMQKALDEELSKTLQKPPAITMLDYEGTPVVTYSETNNPALETEGIKLPSSIEYPNLKDESKKA